MKDEALKLAPCPTCEALARTVMMDQTAHDTQRQPWINRINGAVLAEREALCKAMEDQNTWNWDDPADTAIQVIRARGNT